MEISRLTQSGDWLFEIKHVVARRTDEYGQPFTATFNIFIQGDTARIENFLRSDGQEITHSDKTAIKKYLLKIGILKSDFIRFKD